MYQAMKIALEYNYDEINLNCGCPSDKVAGKGCFGAALMLAPGLVGDVCQSIHQACKDSGHGHVPVSVKCRIGVDDRDSYEELAVFIDKVASTAPVRRFDIHARKCILKGLTPAQNRSIPPLRSGWNERSDKVGWRLVYYLRPSLLLKRKEKKKHSRSPWQVWSHLQAD